MLCMTLRFMATPIRSLEGDCHGHFAMIVTKRRPDLELETHSSGVATSRSLKGCGIASDQPTDSLWVGDRVEFPCLISMVLPVPHSSTQQSGCAVQLDQPCPRDGTGDGSDRRTGKAAGRCVRQIGYSHGAAQGKPAPGSFVRPEDWGNYQLGYIRHYQIALRVPAQ